MSDRAVPWMPDLCQMSRLATMLGLAELAVVVIALAPSSGHWSWQHFVLASGLALWLALSVSTLLCVAGRRLAGWPARLGFIVAVALAALVAAIGAAIVHALLVSVRSNTELAEFWRFTGGSAAIMALLTALALRYFYVIDRWRAQVGASSRAEADALQARIRPHFLFNSMNTIAGLIPRDAVLAERTVLDLSDLFRAAVGAGRDDSTLAEEVQLAEQYLAIESLRLGDRLRVAWQRGGDLPWALPMPRLLLQPLLENAVLHGVSCLPAGGTIDIALSADARTLQLRIDNDAPPPADAHGAQHAQHNIAHRLAHAFGPKARMHAGWREGRYRCEVDIPLPAVMPARKGG